MDFKGIVAFDGTDVELEWWQTTVVYQIYPRSFQDSTCSGVGDLRGDALSWKMMHDYLGILSRLDYIENLGVQTIWLSPIYVSPMKDCGYDISNFLDIDPVFGTLGDFELLVQDIHKRGMKLIMDYIPNHSSDQHPWFKESRKGGSDNRYANYYVWHDGKLAADGNREPPNNWRSAFSGSAWTWEPQRQQYYFHQYLKEQPDLNWENPEVYQEMQDVLEFWLDRGVDGFRIDAISKVFEARDKTQDEPPIPGSTSVVSYKDLEHIYTLDQPETYRLVSRWRRFLDGYEARKGRAHIYMVVEPYSKGELGPTMKYYDYGCDAPFNFALASAGADTGGREILQMVDGWLSTMPKGKWPHWVIGSHDVGRVASRKGAAYVNAVNALLLLLPGTPTTYQGEELGMRNVDVQYATMNDGKSQLEDVTGRSPLQFYRQLVQLRRHPSFQRGSMVYNVTNKDVFSFVRLLENNTTFLVAMNVGNSISNEDYSMELCGSTVTNGNTVLSSWQQNEQNAARSLKSIELQPGDVLVMDISK